jgi:hypothetical protein
MGPTVHTRTQAHRYTSIHTLVESFGTNSEGDVCVCRSAGSGTLTYYTAPRTNPPLPSIYPCHTRRHHVVLYTLTPYIPHTALKTDDQPRTLHTRATTCLLASYSLFLHTRTYTYTHTHTHSFFFLLPSAPKAFDAAHSLFNTTHRTYPIFYSVKLVLLYTHGYYTFMTTLVHCTNLFSDFQYTLFTYQQNLLSYFRNLILCNKV